MKIKVGMIMALISVQAAIAQEVAAAHLSQIQPTVLTELRIMGNGISSPMQMRVISNNFTEIKTIASISADLQTIDIADGVDPKEVIRQMAKAIRQSYQNSMETHKRQRADLESCLAIADAAIKNAKEAIFLNTVTKATGKKTSK